MKNFKKVMIMGAVVLFIGSLSVGVFAQTNYKTPAEAVAGLTNQTVEKVTAERKESKMTYGQIAEKAGKLEQFKLERTEMRKENVAKQVAEEKITQEKADEIIANIESRQADCDKNQLGHKDNHERLGLQAGQKGHGLKNNEGTQSRSGLRFQAGN